MTREVPWRLIAMVGVLLLPACSGGDQEFSDSITVFCGSASKPVMEELAPLFELAENIEVNLIFGGSGTLLSQIQLSRQGEIYLPGSPDYILIGEQKKLLIENSDRIVSYLVPAIITPAGNPAGISSLEDLTREGLRLGLGNPETVCLGLYWIELLENAGITDQVLENTVTFAASCSRTANLAAMGQVDAILGWRVFHHWNKERMSAVQLAPDQIPRISTIPIAIPVFTKSEALSKSFIDFVLSEVGRETYRKFGYLTEEEEARKLAPNAGIGGVYELPADYGDRVRRIMQD